MNKLIPALFLGLLITLPYPILAEQHEPAAEPPWYEFEVLIFQRLNKGAGSTELWPLEDEIREWQDVIPFDTKGKSTIKDDKPIPYRPLPAAERRLNDIWTRFRNSRNYRPLYHVAWRQQVVNPDDAQAIYISLLPEEEEVPGMMTLPKLEGTLKLGVKRYLHISTDLLFRQFSDEGLTTYPMQAQRRMRSGKLHYLDHPLLGVLVQAEKYVPPEPEPEPSPVLETETAEPVQAPSPEGSVPATSPPTQR